MSEQKQNEVPSKTPWYFKRAFVLVNLFFVLGPLALPLLLKSREFSKTEKVMYTTVVLSLTIVVVCLVSFIVKLTLDRFQMYNEILEEAF